MRRHRFLALLIIMTLFLTACGSIPFRNGAHTTFPEEFTGDWYIPPQVREDVHKDKAGIGISEFKVNKDGVLLINDLKYKLKEAEAGLYTSDDGYYIIDLRTDGIMSYKDKDGIQHDYLGVTLYVDGDSTVFMSEEDLEDLKSLISRDAKK